MASTETPMAGTNGELNGHEKEEVPRMTASPTQLSEDESEPDTRRRRHGHGRSQGGSDNNEEDEDEDEDEAEEEESSEEGEDEEEEDEGDEEDEDEEPALKYERIGGAVPDLLKKDSASALAVENKLLALGTHGGIVHILDLDGKRIKSFKPHLASIVDISMDSTADFVATASIDGQVVIRSLSTTESYSFDMKRPMRTVALEPNFAKRNTRAFVCGGLAGNLILGEKGWLGHKETTLHSGEGPIWQVRWRGRLIAWANDLGVKIYDCASQTRITFIDRPADSPRADLFKCTLEWQDDSTLLIAWADHIKVARIRARPRTITTAATANIPPLLVEITAVFQLDCMIAGIVHHPTLLLEPVASQAVILASDAAKISSTPVSPALTSFLIVAYSPPDTFFNERTDDRAQQARKAAERPELRIISRAGEEVAADALSITDFHLWGCNDYVLCQVPGNDAAGTSTDDGRCYVVLSPRDLVLVKPRDRRDHVAWLVERQRYEEALTEVERIEAETPIVNGEVSLSAAEIGQRYIEHLVSEGDFAKAARLCPKVCGQEQKRWEDWIFIFAEKRQLQAIIPFVPTEAPRLDHLVYEMMLAHFLTHDRQALLQTVRDWPRDIYDIAAVIVAVRSELDKAASTSLPSSGSKILMECLAELYTANRQPGKALPYFLRLRRPNVFDLIRENNLFTDVRDQVLLLVQFDDELMKQRKRDGQVFDEGRSEAITLLVDNIHSIPIGRVVQQLESTPYYLFLYLDALVMEKDPNLTSDFADLQVKLYAEFATPRLIDFLRASNYYNLEMAYKVCKERDLVLEMVFLLGRMGNNKQALTLIIERLGDVHRAIEFAKEQGDDDLWEDLLKYSETRPAFIRGLLENVGVEISPIRLIRRIKNGLEIPGLKEALIKILQDFHLQISLLEGCQTIMNGDSSDLSRQLQSNQTSGFFLTAKSICPVCSHALQEDPRSLLLLFLCRHVVHSHCASGGDQLPHQPDPALRGVGMGSAALGVSGRIAFESVVRARIRQGCPVCHQHSEGLRI